MPEYIDIHAHLNFKIFDKNREDIISRTLNDKTWVINIGTQLDTSKKAVEISNQYNKGVYATVGLHPVHTSSSYYDESELGESKKDFTNHGEVFDKDKYRELIKKGKVVAIGECGLDYFHLKEGDKDKQLKAFIEQIELANEFNIPLMLHLRNKEEDIYSSAYQDALKILKEKSKVKGVIHFFAGELKDALDFIDYGFLISFAGVVTYPPKKNNPRNIDIIDIIKKSPLNMILADTDSPYVAPVPNRGKDNEPLNVKYIVSKIAEIKNIPIEEAKNQIVENAKILFKI